MYGTSRAVGVGPTPRPRPSPPPSLTALLLPPPLQVLGVYSGKRWLLIEEQINTVLGNQAMEAGDRERALWHYRALLEACPQRPPQVRGDGCGQPGECELVATYRRTYCLPTGNHARSHLIHACPRIRKHVFPTAPR